MWINSARYGEMRLIADFKAKVPDLKIGDKCIIKTERGTEIGTIISFSKPMPEKQDPKSLGDVLRRVTPDDLKQLENIRTEKMPAEFIKCQEKIKQFNLPMNLAFMEHLFGGEKVVFYFLSEGRVDFRELVKELAREYKTRIEMRQIGVRDEARLLADYEHCGLELCCKTFLKDLEPVSMKMAKMQKTTLDPIKVSGRCGRLMCCLKFEDELYNELKSRLPRKGSLVQIEKGIGEVVETEILSQRVTVELDNRSRIKIDAKEIIKVTKGPSLKVEENAKTKNKDKQ